MRSRTAVLVSSSCLNFTKSMSLSPWKFVFRSYEETLFSRVSLRFSILPSISVLKPWTIPSVSACLFLYWLSQKDESLMDYSSLSYYISIFPISILWSADYKWNFSYKSSFAFTIVVYVIPMFRSSAVTRPKSCSSYSSLFAYISILYSVLNLHACWSLWCRLLSTSLESFSFWICLFIMGTSSSESFTFL